MNVKVQVPSYSNPASFNGSGSNSQVELAPEVASRTADSKVPAAKKSEAKDRAATDPQSLDKIVDKMNKTLEVYNYDLRFEIVDKHRIVISIINSSTGEVLKQIPPEDLVKSFKQMDEFLGVLVDRKV